MFCTTRRTVANQEHQNQELPIAPVETNGANNILAAAYYTEENENAINKRSLELQNGAIEAKEVGDLDTAETLVFRPLFRSRYLLNRRRPYYNRRRFYRSVEDPNNDLNTDETLVFRPFFGRRFSYARRRFPNYYYY